MFAIDSYSVCLVWTKSLFIHMNRSAFRFKFSAHPHRSLSEIDFPNKPMVFMKCSITHEDVYLIFPRETQLQKTNIYQDNLSDCFFIEISDLCKEYCSNKWISTRSYTIMMESYWNYCVTDDSIRNHHATLHFWKLIRATLKKTNKFILQSWYLSNFQPSTTKLGNHQLWSVRSG